MLKKNAGKISVVAFVVAFFSTALQSYLSSTFISGGEVLTGANAIKQMISSFGWAAYMRSFVAVLVLNFFQIMVASLLVLLWIGSGKERSSDGEQRNPE